MEEKLSRIKVKFPKENEKDSLWHNILAARIDEERNPKQSLLFSVFNFQMKKIIIGVIALAMVLGGGGMVAASNDAAPGDFLFPLDLTVEKLQIKLANEVRTQELKLKFAEERVVEIKQVSEKRRSNDDSFSFSSSEEEDVGRALTNLEELLGDDESEKAEELRESLQEILVLLGDDGKLEIRRNGSEIKIETKNGEVKIEVKEDHSGRSGDDDENDDGSDDSDDSDDGDKNEEDVREDDSEIFCRGEWRDPEDCDDSSDSDSDDGDDDQDDSNNDDSKSGKDDDSEDDEDRDGSNSGSGRGDDN